MVLSVSAQPLPQASGGSPVVEGLEPGTELKARVEANLPGGVVRLTSNDARVDLRVASPLPVGSEVTVTVTGSKQQPAIQITVSGAPQGPASAPQQTGGQAGGPTVPANSATAQTPGAQPALPRPSPALTHFVQTLPVSPQPAAPAGETAPQPPQAPGGTAVSGSTPGNPTVPAQGQLASLTVSTGNQAVPPPVGAPSPAPAGSASQASPVPITSTAAPAGPPQASASGQPGATLTTPGASSSAARPDTITGATGTSTGATGTSVGGASGANTGAALQPPPAARPPSREPAVPSSDSTPGRPAAWAQPVLQPGPGQSVGGAAAQGPQQPAAGTPAASTVTGAVPGRVAPGPQSGYSPATAIQAGPTVQSAPQAGGQGVAQPGHSTASMSASRPQSGGTANPAANVPQGVDQAASRPVSPVPTSSQGQTNPVSAGLLASGSNSAETARTGPVPTGLPRGPELASPGAGGTVSAPAARPVLQDTTLARAGVPPPYASMPGKAPMPGDSQGISKGPPGPVRQIAENLQGPLAEQQAGLGNLFAQIGALVGARSEGKVSLPDPVVKAMQQILGLRLNPSANLSGKDLQAAVRLSGQFREAQLPSPGGGQQPLPDLKSALLSLKSLLQQFGAEARINRPAGQPVTPSRHGAPRGQAQQSGGGFWAGDTAQNLKSLLQETDSALARIRLTQLVNSGLAKDDGPRHASRPMDLVLELPIALGQETGVMQMQVGRDGGGKDGEDEHEPAWRLRFALDLTATGPLEAAISLRGGGTYASLWVDRKETFDHLNALRETMEAAFADAGLDLQEFRLIRGLPPRTAARSGALIDRQS